MGRAHLGPVGVAVHAQPGTTSDDGDVAVVRASPLPAFLFDLHTCVILGASNTFAGLVGIDEHALVGRSMWDLLPDGPHGIAQLIAQGTLAGAELRHHLLCPDGSAPEVRMWMRATNPGPHPTRALAVISSSLDASHLAVAPSAGFVTRAMVIGTVDAQWRIDRISSDVGELLGHSAADVVGRSILEAVHPDDSPVLITAVGQATNSGRGVAFAARLARGDGSWLPCDLLVSPLSRPPRFAFVVSGSEVGGAPGTTAAQTEQDLWYIAQGAKAAEAGALSEALPSAVSEPRMNKLSARELDIVGRLARGKRVPAIAAELFLTQGTVRNHLSSVYRKLDVNSQQGLLDLIHRR